MYRRLHDALLAEAFACTGIHRLGDGSSGGGAPGGGGPCGARFLAFRAAAAIWPLRGVRHRVRPCEGCGSAPRPPPAHSRVSGWGWNGAGGGEGPSSSAICLRVWRGGVRRGGGCVGGLLPKRLGAVLRERWGRFFGSVGGGGPGGSQAAGMGNCRAGPRRLGSGSPKRAGSRPARGKAPFRDEGASGVSVNGGSQARRTPPRYASKQSAGEDGRNKQGSFPRHR